MYQYKSNYDNDYEKIVKEVVQEHREGIIDPTRVVGKEERKKSSFSETSMCFSNCKSTCPKMSQKRSFF